MKRNSLFILALWMQLATVGWTQKVGAISSPGKAAQGLKNTPLTKQQLTVLANGGSANHDDDMQAILFTPPITFTPVGAKDPLKDYLQEGQSANPIYGVGFKTWVIFDAWWLRMGTCIDRCEAFWAAYPQTREAKTQKEATQMLGYGENITKAFVDISKGNPDLGTVFLFYDGYAGYYNDQKLSYVPLRKYAGKVTLGINWLAMDPYDIYLAILSKNLGMLDAKESSGLNRGDIKFKTTFIPAKK